MDIFLTAKKKNATYMNPTVQNKIIYICCTTEINKYSCFVFLCDEILDVTTGIEQHSLRARYIIQKNNFSEDLF